MISLRVSRLDDECLVMSLDDEELLLNDSAQKDKGTTAKGVELLLVLRYEWGQTLSNRAQFFAVNKVSVEADEPGTGRFCTLIGATASRGLTPSRGALEG